MSKFEKYISLINYHILKNLIKKKKKIPICSFKIEISETFKTYLKNKFKITGRFKSCKSFFNNFKIINERYFNKINFCTFDPDTFYIKISNKKTLKYLDKNLKEKIILSKSNLSIKFYRIDKIKNL